VFYPVAIEINGRYLRYHVTELIEEIGKCTTSITGDPKETTYLFQQLSVAL